MLSGPVALNGLRFFINFNTPFVVTLILPILGEGSQRDSLVALCESINISGAVRFPGTTEAVLNEVSNADLLVSSSRYEGFSNTLLEAMALGTPVVATNCPGATKELVIDGKTGTLVPALSVDAIYDGMLRALRADSARISSAARVHVETNFGEEVTIRQYSDLFERHV